jgi:plasmid maintenance system antidote protein VapI
MADVLRQAIRASGKSYHEISRQTGVATSVISRFLADKRDLTLTTANKLAVYLGLELRRRGNGR